MMIAYLGLGDYLCSEEACHLLAVVDGRSSLMTMSVVFGWWCLAEHAQVHGETKEV